MKQPSFKTRVLIGGIQPPLLTTGLTVAKLSYEWEGLDRRMTSKRNLSSMNMYNNGFGWKGGGEGAVNPVAL